MNIALRVEWINLDQDLVINYNFRFEFFRFNLKIIIYEINMGPRGIQQSFWG